MKPLSEVAPGVLVIQIQAVCEGKNLIIRLMIEKTFGHKEITNIFLMKIGCNNSLTINMTCSLDGKIVR